MVNFKVFSFQVNLTKQQGYYVTISGQPEGRLNSMRVKKFLKKDKLEEILPLLMEGQLPIIILGRREQSDFEQKHNIQYYDFLIASNDWEI
jgi:hypothetical protein